MVKVEATGVCRSDWHGWMGHAPDITLPRVPGHELAGAVVSTGKDVTRCCRDTLALGKGTVLTSGPTLKVLSQDLIRRLYRVEARIKRGSRGFPVMIVDGPAQAPVATPEPTFP